MHALTSPRRRRRLTIAVLVVAAAAILAVVGAHYTTSGSPEDATGPYVKDNSYKEPKHVPFTMADRRAVGAVLAKFIATAVARHHVGASWDLASSTLREGVAYKEWATGDIPVVPYPAARHGQGSWTRVDYSYRNRVGLEVLVFPKPRSGYSLATGQADFVRGRDGRWRVDYWMVTKFHGPGAAAPSDVASALSEGPANVHKLPGKEKRHAAKRTEGRSAASASVAHLSRWWLLVPVGLLGLTFVLPIGIGTAYWIRNRRALTEYHRGGG